MDPYPELILSPYLSRREAAEYLGVTERTIDRLRAEGKLSAVRVGPKLIRIPLTSITALLAAGGE